MKRLLSPTGFCLLVLPVLIASAVAVLLAMPTAPEAAKYAVVLCIESDDLVPAIIKQ